MKDLSTLVPMQEIINSGFHMGNRRPQGRVTVDVNYYLNTTEATVGTSTRGPYRWFQDSENTQLEIEVPGIQLITINRSLDQDAATCTITLDNTSLATQEALDTLGAPGYMWPEHGLNPDAPEEWGQVANMWANILDVNCLCRTFEGWGGHPLDPTAPPNSIQSGLENGYITMTGMWLVDSVTNNNGVMTLNCRDMMKLLIDQQIYPPLVPTQFYPLEYQPPGMSVFDSAYEENPYRVILDDFNGIGNPGTISVCAHPTGEGYWILDQEGTVTAFGPDATDYGGTSASDPVQCRAMVAKSDGTGYWILKSNGEVTAHGGASDFGDASGESALAALNTATDLAKTFDDAGYWVLYRGGQMRSFGNAPEYNTSAGPNQVPIRMMQAAFDTYGWSKPPLNNTVTAGVGHPTAMGLWVTDGNGEVTGFGASASLTDSVTRRARLEPHEWPHGMEATPDGGGYWLAFGSGTVFAFGNAQDHGDAKLSPNVELVFNNPDNGGLFYFKLVTDVSRSSDGKGVYVVRVDGTVEAIDCKFWGDLSTPVFPDSDGSYDDLVDIIREVIMWSGFLLKEDSPTEANPYACLESTGIVASDYPPGQAPQFTAENLDKKPVIDIINTIKQIVGYLVYVDSEGAFTFTSPNFYEAGNFLLDGTHVDDFIVLDEAKTLTNYQVTKDGSPLRSSITVSTYDVNEEHPDETIVGQYIPPFINLLRGMQVPAAWIEQNLSNASQKEIQLLAEMIGIFSWFAMRTGSITALANPALDINSQLQIIERQTSDTYYHYVKSMSTTNDIVNGDYTMTLTTNRVGTSSTWIITADDTSGDQNRLTIPPEVQNWLNEDGYSTRTRTINRPTGLPAGGL